LANGSAADIHENGQIPGLSLVWAGETREPWRGEDLISSPHMDTLVEGWKGRYDFVLLDSAPVLPVPDAAGLARFCDRAMLIVRYGSTRMQSAERSYRMIYRNIPNGAELDVVMNGVPINSADYVAYYGYKGSDYAQRVGHA
jgi:Mrp family chromosome partitioning ATPase